MALKTCIGSCVFGRVHPGWPFSYRQILLTILSTLMTIGMWTGVMYQVLNMVQQLSQLQIPTRWPRMQITWSLQNNDLGCLFVASNYLSGNINKGHTNMGYISLTAPLQGNYWQPSFCSFMNPNTMANNGEPHPIHDPKGHNQHLSYTCNHQTCYSHEVLCSWTVLH